MLTACCEPLSTYLILLLDVLILLLMRLLLLLPLCFILLVKHWRVVAPIHATSGFTRRP